ncbi:MAG: FAD-dependent oxidoreductase [Myxococcales bacterium]|nr:FAD-dependent oxidoreductase [Myxococcales bacterium]
MLRLAPHPGYHRHRLDVHRSLDEGGPLRVLARHVVLSVPAFVRNLLLAGRQTPLYRPDYVPWMVTNLHLRDRPPSEGFETAWDNVIVDSESLGYVVATHQSGSSFGPTVWTHYRPFTARDARSERTLLQSLTFEDASTAVIADLARSIPDLHRFVERVEVLRWGHAMVRPAPGTAFSKDRKRACEPIDGIHFAHTDLGGAALIEEAVTAGDRAGREILADRRAG